MYLAVVEVGSSADVDVSCAMLSDKGVEEVMTSIAGSEAVLLEENGTMLK